MKNKGLIQFLILTLLAVGLTACAAKTAFKKGTEEARKGHWDAAVIHYTRATRENPDNIEYRMALQRALAESARIHLSEGRKKLAAEDLEGAIEEIQLAVDLDPTNRYAQDELAEAKRQLKERDALIQEVSEFEQRRARVRELFQTQPVLEPSSTAPINLKFAQDTSLQKIFEVLSKLSGINVLFDESFRDKRVTIDLADVSFREALDKLVMVNRLFYKVVDPSTIIIVPDNAQKHRQYDDLALKTFYIVNAEVNTVANMLRTIAGIQRVQPNPELKSITVRATPDQIAVAERIVQLNDKTKSEIILDIEILAINRTKALEFGLRFSEYAVGLTYQPAGSTVDQGNTTVRLNRLANVDTSDFLMSFPSSAIYRFFKSTSEVTVLSAPKLRATEGQPATLSIGREVPIPVTSFVSQFGQPGALPTTPVTSFQYRNVGVNIVITPKVFVDGEIELELDLETSDQLETRVIGGIELPVFGTRNVKNVVRLRDGETNLIGGLINARQGSSVSGVPGVTDVPILNKIFADNSRASDQQDVVFSITPHIVRAPRVTERDLLALPMGTEQRIKVDTGGASPFAPPPEPPAPPDTTPAAAPPAVPEEPSEEPSPEATTPTDPTTPGEPPATEPAEAEPEPPRRPSGPVSMLFSPPTASAAVGEIVELVLVAGGADGLSSGNITITFDATVLDAVDVRPGPFLSIDGRQTDFVPVIEPGQVRIQFARQDDTLGLRGSGHIVRLLFEVTNAGPASIVSATGSLMDSQGGVIPASFASARIETR
jgi:general secretion pathway protein D